MQCSHPKINLKIFLLRHCCRRSKSLWHTLKTLLATIVYNLKKIIGRNTSKINFVKIGCEFLGLLSTNPRFDDTSIFYLSQLKKRYVAISDITSGSLAMAETDISKGASPPGYATGEVNVDAKLRVIEYTMVKVTEYSAVNVVRNAVCRFGPIRAAKMRPCQYKITLYIYTINSGAQKDYID